MTSQIQEITDLELEELKTAYDLWVDKRIGELQLKKEGFKKSRTMTNREWANLDSQKRVIEKHIESLTKKLHDIEKRESICLCSIRNKSRNIRAISNELNDLKKSNGISTIEEEKKKKQEPAPATPQPQEEFDLFDPNAFIDQGTGIDISDSEPDHGFNDIKKDIEKFFEINNEFNQSIRDDPKRAALFGLNDKADDDVVMEPFTYTSITIKKP